jgi:hypothetical protein
MPAFYAYHVSKQIDGEKGKMRVVRLDVVIILKYITELNIHDPIKYQGLIA